MGCTLFTYFIFVQFMQFPLLYFELAHSGSQPSISAYTYSCMIAMCVHTAAHSEGPGRGALGDLDGRSGSGEQRPSGEAQSR